MVTDQSANQSQSLCLLETWEPDHNILERGGRINLVFVKNDQNRNDMPNRQIMLVLHLMKKAAGLGNKIVRFKTRNAEYGILAFSGSE